MHLLVFIGIVVVNERGQEACSVGMRKGVGGRVLESLVKAFPFLKEGGGQCCILLRIRNEDVIVIVVEWVGNGSCVGFGKLAGRDFS